MTTPDAVTADMNVDRAAAASVFDRPGTVRQDRADDYEVRPVSVPAVTVTGGTVVERAHAAMQHAAKAHAKWTASIPREHFSQAGLEAQLSKFADTEAAKSVERAAADVAARAEEAGAAAQSILDGLTVSPDDEVHATRYWARSLRTLESTPGAGMIDTARKLLAGASERDIPVLVEELPAFLSAHDVPTDWLDGALAERLPAYAAARAKQTKAEQARLIVERNRSVLADNFKTGRARATTLVPPTGKYDPDR